MLPELPKKKNKREAHWTTTIFRKWCEKNCNNSVTVFEVKHTRGKDYLPFSEVKEKQIAKMLKIRHGTFVWKNPDMGEETPPDIFAFHKAPVFIVIKYVKFFCLISIDTFVLESQRSKRRSLTAERAKEIAFQVIHK